MTMNRQQLTFERLAVLWPNARGSVGAAAVSAAAAARVLAIRANAAWLSLATATVPARRGLRSPAQCLLQLALLGAAVPPVRSDLPSAWLSLLDGYGSRAAAESAATAITPTWFSQYSQTDTYISLLFQAWQAKYNVVYTSPAEVSC